MRSWVNSRSVMRTHAGLLPSQATASPASARVTSTDPQFGPRLVFGCRPVKGAPAVPPHRRLAPAARPRAVPARQPRHARDEEAHGAGGGSPPSQPESSASAAPITVNERPASRLVMPGRAEHVGGWQSRWPDGPLPYPLPRRTVGEGKRGSLGGRQRPMRAGSGREGGGVAFLPSGLPYNTGVKDGGSILGGLSPRGVPARALAKAAPADPAGHAGVFGHCRSGSVSAAGDARRCHVAAGDPASAAAAAGARWERHDGPFGGLEAGMLPASELDAAGQRRGEPGAGRLGDPARLLVHPVGAHRRPDGQLRGGRRLGRAARRSLRRVPAAGAGAAALADQRRSATARWIPDAAIKVLRSFVPEQEWLLEPGDMLYLPPGVAHHGVAEGPCFTYSIGFPAPSHAELVPELLRLPRRGAGPRTDPDGALPGCGSEAAPRSRCELGDAMVAEVAALFERRRAGTGLMSATSSGAC